MNDLEMAAEFSWVGKLLAFISAVLVVGAAVLFKYYDPLPSALTMFVAGVLAGLSGLWALIARVLKGD